jgi:hypothetical protein
MKYCMLVFFLLHHVCLSLYGMEKKTRFDLRANREHTQDLPARFKEQEVEVKEVAAKEIIISLWIATKKDSYYKCMLLEKQEPGNYKQVGGCNLEKKVWDQCRNGDQIKVDFLGKQIYATRWLLKDLRRDPIGFKIQSPDTSSQKGEEKATLQSDTFLYVKYQKNVGLQDDSSDGIESQADASFKEKSEERVKLQEDVSQLPRACIQPYVQMPKIIQLCVLALIYIAEGFVPLL